MGFYATESVLAKPDHRPKNRVWGFSALPIDGTPRFPSQVLETQWEDVPTASATATDVVDWLSNDPIGISGGLNQYVFCGNDPVNNKDPLGYYSLLHVALITVGIVAGGLYVLKKVINNAEKMTHSCELDGYRVNRVADQLKLVGQFSGNTKFNELEASIREGSYHIRIVKGADVKGLHVTGPTDSILFVSESETTNGDLELALVVFGEYQHSGQGGSLSERNAENEFQKAVNSLPLKDRTETIMKLHHK